MSLAIEILKGPRQGKKYNLKAGLVIGRSQADISLHDPKVSSQHAHIKNVEDKFYLVDNNSANGIIVDGEKVRHVHLTPGIIIQIGKTILRVFLSQSPSQEKSKNAVQPSAAPQFDDEATVALDQQDQTEKKSSQSKPPESVASSEPQITPKKASPNKKPSSKPKSKSKAVPDALDPKLIDLSEKPSKAASPKAADQDNRPTEDVVIQDEPEAAPPSWRRSLASFIKTTLKKVKNKASKIEPLEKPITLEIYRGIQYDTTWTLGYGPRSVGPLSFEFPIFEPSAPDTCFEIHPHAKGVQFVTQYPTKVLFNGHPEESALLKEGDVISILNQTFIEVKWAYEAD